MNLLVLEPADLTSANTAEIRGRRYEHICQVLKATAGDSLSVGILNGFVGHGLIRSLADGCATIELGDITTPPPPPLPLELILALPRPRMMHRLLQTITTLGVTQIHLLQTARVEKSYWQTPVLTADSIHEQLMLGLEQACITRLPEVQMHKRFVPFMEDMLPGLMAGKQGYVAHPTTAPTATPKQGQTTLLAIGPEGGFLPQEVERFVQAGFNAFSLGPRILKVETAVPVSITRLYPI